mgnify:CR=1 FL=1
MDVGSVLFDGPLLADYHQLYVQDAGFTGAPPPTPAQWADEDVRRRLNVNEGSIVVSTARNMTVPFRLAAFTRKCEKKIAGFRDAGVTILLVSHSAQIVLEACTRAIWLDRGRLLADGPPPEVVAAYDASTYASEG